ncbi:hypothetical protein [Francisella philomiragia]|nr:hypothetical protein [Francisella philomiragia]
MNTLIKTIKLISPKFRHRKSPGSDNRHPLMIRFNRPQTDNLDEN